MKLLQVKPLYDMGFAILRLLPNSKRPSDAGWATGPRASWDHLSRHFKNADNVGVRFGEASKLPDGSYLCALDCDVKSSDPLHLEEMERALLNFCPASDFAPKVISGRGGGSCHIYFRTMAPQVSFNALRSGHKVKVLMPSVEASKKDREALTEAEIAEGYRSRIAWEVDVMGEGKQAVLPPSIHPDTYKEYTWEGQIREYESIPLHENFIPKSIQLKKPVKGDVSFKEVDLLDVKINSDAFDLITSGRGSEKYPSRSEALYSALNALVMAGLSDAEINSVLTDEAYDISSKPLEAGRGSKEKAAHWLSGQIAKIRYDKSAERVFGSEVIVDDIDEMLSDAEGEAQADDLVDWVSSLRVDKAGNYKPTAYNVYLILKNLTGGVRRKGSIFARDEFNLTNTYSDLPPWGDISDVGREIKDGDDVAIKIWLSDTWRIEVSTTSVFEVVNHLATESSFHPVKDYLESLKWDGVPRIAGFLKDYAGASDSNEEYLSQVSAKTLLAAVARIYNPGCKFDHVLIIEGFQGKFKSSALNALASPWVTDTLGDIHSKDVVDNLRGKWLVELGELSSMNRSEVNDLKAFITRQVDVVRKAYGRRAESYPRQCIFIGTTNDDEYLKDATGGRRYWPVRIDKFDLDKVVRDRDMLWAEAFEKYMLGGVKLYLEGEEVNEYASGVQRSRYMVDEIANPVAAVIAQADFPEKFTFDDVWSRMSIAEGRIGKLCDYNMQLRIKKALRAAGYQKIRIHGGSYYWLKSKNETRRSY